MISKKDLKKYKFIITTGCSYGVVHESFNFEGALKTNATRKRTYSMAR